MNVEQFLLGPMANLIHILIDPKTSKVAVVDPAWEVPFIIEKLKENKWTLDKILLTHGHYDHTNGVEELLAYLKVPVYLSKIDETYLAPPLFLIPPISFIELKDGDSIEIGNSTVSVLHMPGHSPGLMCFMTEEHLIAGDLIFVEGCGRVDLEGSNPEEMYHSLQKLRALPDHLRVWPGHDSGQTSSALLGDLKKSNPYLNQANMAAFFSKRGV